MTAIPIPTAPATRRQQREDYGPDFITLAEAETLVQATGQHRGTVLEFSDNGVDWMDAWTPVLLDHPTHARATVLRKYDDGDTVPTIVVVRWDEFVPDLSSDRRSNWDKMPTTLLGKVAKVSCYRGAFRDVIGNRYEPAELDQATRPRLAITA